MVAADMMTPFQWGSGGKKLTPEQVKRQREIAAALMQSGTDTSPVGHWTQGLARVAQALVGRIVENRAERAETEGRAGAASALSDLSGSYYFPPAPGGGVNPGTPASMATMPAPDMPSARVAQAHGGGGFLPQSFLSAVDRTEGAGGYDTLFGHAQQGPFSGTDVSQMTTGDALAFADPSGAYGQHVRNQIGRVATPMGRHQIVGTTLRNASRELGLDPSTPFNA